MTLNYAIWWFLRPSHGLLFMLLLGVVLLLARRPRLGRALVVAGTGGFLLATLLPFGSWLLVPLEDRFPEPVLPARVDGIIVLAGSEEPAPTAARETIHFSGHGERLTAALLLARRYPDALVVHSGRYPSYERDGHVTTASDVARELFVGAGVDPARLVLEGQSVDTCESPAAVATLVAPEPDQTWLLVTSAFHMPRAMACYRAAGFPVVAFPVDYQQSTGYNPLATSMASNLADLDLAVHEWLGLAYYRVRGVTDELWPSP